MRTSVYSFGVDSPVKFRIPDKVAKKYNEAVHEFLRAQTRFNQKYASKWNPSRKPIRIKWSRAHINARNIVIDMVTERIAKDGINPTWDFTDDYLVKSGVAVAAILQFGSELDWAVRLGIIHGLLQKR